MVSHWVPLITQCPQTTLTFSINSTHKPLRNSGTRRGPPSQLAAPPRSRHKLHTRPSHHCTCTKDVLECRGSPPFSPLLLLLHHRLPDLVHVSELLGPADFQKAVVFSFLLSCVMFCMWHRCFGPTSTYFHSEVLSSFLQPKRSCLLKSQTTVGVRSECGVPCGSRASHVVLHVKHQGARREGVASIVSQHGRRGRMTTNGTTFLDRVTQPPLGGISNSVGAR